jgi:hypothetical protein
MTAKTAFSPGEWKIVLEGPPTVGMIVIPAARGGMFRETIAMSKAYTEARAEHGDSELLREASAGAQIRPKFRPSPPCPLRARQNGRSG